MELFNQLGSVSASFHYILTDNENMAARSSRAGSRLQLKPSTENKAPGGGGWPRVCVVTAHTVAGHAVAITGRVASTAAEVTTDLFVFYYNGVLVVGECKESKCYVFDRKLTLRWLMSGKAGAPQSDHTPVTPGSLSPTPRDEQEAGLSKPRPTGQEAMRCPIYIRLYCFIWSLLTFLPHHKTLCQIRSTFPSCVC